MKKMIYFQEWLYVIWKPTTVAAKNNGALQSGKKFDSNQHHF